MQLKPCVNSLYKCDNGTYRNEILKTETVKDLILGLITVFRVNRDNKIFVKVNLYLNAEQGKTIEDTKCIIFSTDYFVRWGGMFRMLNSTNIIGPFIPLNYDAVSLHSTISQIAFIINIKYELNKKTVI